MEKVALCADEMMMRHPKAFGLEGENLQAQSWLKLYTDVEEARLDLGQRQDIGEVWVAPHGSMDPVNFAAALKKDNSARKIYILADNPSGSYRSRAIQAGVECLLSQASLAHIYRQRKLAETPLSAGGISLETLCGTSSGVQRFAAPITVTTPLDSAEGGDGLRPESGHVLGSASQGFLLPVVSGSGGCGKSTICCLMAVIAQQAGINTLLVDCDLLFGDCQELLGLEMALPLDEAVKQPSRVAQAKQKQGKPALIAPPGRMEDVERLQKSLPQIIQAARDSYDLVIVNTGSFWTEQHVTLLECCSKAIFLLDQRPSSLRGCKRALDLCSRCGVAASPFVFVINRCSRNARYSSLDITCAFKGAQSLELRDGGTDVEDFMAAAQPEDVVHTHNALALSLESLLGRLVPAAAEVGLGKAPTDARNGFLSSLLKR